MSIKSNGRNGYQAIRKTVMTNTKAIINWKCGFCQEDNKWKWDSDDLIEGKITMECDHCKNKTFLFFDSNCSMFYKSKDKKSEDIVGSVTYKSQLPPPEGGGLS